MPNIPRIGVSKKIEEWEERNRLKDIVRKQLPEGMGAIIRTTCEGRDAKVIAKDISFLVNRWHAIQKAFAAAKPAEKIHEDLELSLQVVRDNLDDDVEAVITDDVENQKSLYAFIKNSAPEYAHKLSLYEGTQTVFAHYGIDKQLNQALEKKVELPSGGSLIIETTEAMTVIDVNSGGFTGRSNMEDTILQINLESAQEVVRQLRLRNIGGLIVIDFIDMASPANRQKLFNVFEKALRERDKFQSVVLKVSEFGLVQMTRKRSGLTLVQQLTDDCATCGGSGFVTSLQEECFAILRSIKHELQTGREQSKPLVVNVNPALFDQITTIEYNAILLLEKQFNRKIELVAKKGFRPDQFSIEKT
jgi:ribonuclease G